MEASISDLPNEVLLIIFKLLPFPEILRNCSKTCKRWRIIIAQLIFAPYLKLYIQLDDDIKSRFVKEGWNEDLDREDLIIRLCYTIQALRGTIMISILV